LILALRFDCPFVFVLPPSPEIASILFFLLTIAFALPLLVLSIHCEQWVLKSKLRPLFG